VPVDQWQAHRERLGHPDECVVDGAVAVRMQLSHDVADDASALDVAAVGAQAHFPHLVQDPPVHRLEPVTGVGQGPGVDDGVGVLEERAAHLGRDIGLDDALLEVLGGRCRAAARHAGILARRGGRLRQRPTGDPVHARP
jgi:hypothetical protein